MTSVFGAKRGEQRGERPVRRVVLLGASNLTNSIGTVVQTAANLWGGPLEVLAAWGHGRSYGRASRVLGRELPGIRQCRLWADLADAPALPTSALVTDIGNDLLYEEPVERIAGWVEECFDRLADARAGTIVTLLPLDNLPRISPARYYFFRTLFVPRSRIGREEIMRRAGQLDERVRRLAQDRGFATIRPRAQWYGFDPIHVRFLKRRLAWREILGGWAGPGAIAEPAGGAVARAIRLRICAPERRRVFGFEQRSRQPAVTFGDGTTVAIY